MAIETNHPLIEEILFDWKTRIGDEYDDCRGHVYRMFNFCLALRRSGTTVAEGGKIYVKS